MKKYNDKPYAYDVNGVPLNQTLIIPLSSLQEHNITNLKLHVLSMMNLVVAIDYEVPCFYIVKNRWGIDGGGLKNIKKNPIPIRYLESFLLKPDASTMDELYQNAEEYNKP